MIRASAERRARVRPTRRRVSIVAPRRANARWRRAAGARSSRRRVDRVERARVSSSVSSLTTGCPPSVNHSINQINHSCDPERHRARSTPRVAARSRCVRVRPIHRLDSTRRATDTGASVRAELEQTPPPPPRLRRSTEHHHSTDRTRAIDRSTRVPRLATRRRIGRFLSHALPFHSSARAAAAKTILRKTAATPLHTPNHTPSSPPPRVSHTALGCSNRV